MDGRVALSPRNRAHRALEDAEEAAARMARVIGERDVDGDQSAVEVKRMEWLLPVRRVGGVPPHEACTVDHRKRVRRATRSRTHSGGSAHSSIARGQGKQTIERGRPHDLAEQRLRPYHWRGRVCSALEAHASVGHATRRTCRHSPTLLPWCAPGSYGSCRTCGRMRS